MSTNSRLVLTAVALLCACSGTADSAAAQADVRDACELLPASIVEEMVGGRVQVESLGISPATNWSACGYLDPADGLPWLEVQVTWAGGRDKAREERENTSRFVAVQGLGDGAWLSTSPGRLSQLLHGDVLIQFHMALLPDASAQMMTDDITPLRQHFETLSRAVLARL